MQNPIKTLTIIFIIIVVATVLTSCGASKSTEGITAWGAQEIIDARAKQYALTQGCKGVIHKSECVSVIPSSK